MRPWYFWAAQALIGLVILASIATQIYLLVDLRKMRRGK